MRQALLFTVVLACVASPVAADVLRGGRCVLPKLGLSFSTVNSLMASPSTINFLASNPNGGVANASSAASVNWSVAGAPLSRTGQ